MRLRWSFLAVLVGTFAILLLAQGMASSRAGLGLAGLATFASFSLMVPLRHQKSRFRSARYLVAAAAIGLILISEFALVRIFQRTDLDQVDQYRVQFTQQTWQAAKSYFPIGSGMGTFVPVYFSIEKPISVTSEFVNRAHDDFVETWLEAGVLAPAIVLAFLGWWVFRLVQIWRRPMQSGDRRIASPGSINQRDAARVALRRRLSSPHDRDRDPVCRFGRPADRADGQVRSGDGRAKPLSPETEGSSSGSSRSKARDRCRNAAGAIQEA